MAKAKTENIKAAKAHIRYKLADGTIVPGVTTVLGVLGKPGLVKWANNLGLQGIDSSKYVDALASIGTLAHYLVECDLRGVEPDVSDYTSEQIDKASNALLSWYEWKKGKDVEPIFQELPMVSELYRFGGMVDCYALIDGVLTLLDIKTSKAIYSEHLTQVSAYQRLLQENGHEVEQSMIVRIGRTEDEAWEARSVKNASTHWELFEHCLAVYQLQKKLRKD